MTGALPRPSLRVRALAFALDYIVIAAYLVGLGGLFALLRIARPEVGDTLFGNPVTGQLTGFVLATLPVTLYFATAEASERRASWGKRRLRLRVTDLDGGRLGLARSLGRSAAKFTPWELAHACIWQSMFAGPNPPPIITAGFVAVYAMIGANLLSVRLSPRGQSLYDLFAGTLVTRSRSEPLTA